MSPLLPCRCMHACSAMRSPCRVLPTPPIVRFSARSRRRQLHVHGARPGLTLQSCRSKQQHACGQRKHSRCLLYYVRDYAWQPATHMQSRTRGGALTVDGLVHWLCLQADFKRVEWMPDQRYRNAACGRVAGGGQSLRESQSMTRAHTHHKPALAASNKAAYHMCPQKCPSLASRHQHPGPARPQRLTSLQLMVWLSSVLSLYIQVDFVCRGGARAS